MTPNDIATSIAELAPVDKGTVTQTVTGTQSFVGGRLTIDDAGGWG